MTRGRWGQGTPLVIIEAWSTPSLGTTVMPRDVEVPPLGLLERDITCFVTKNRMAGVRLEGTRPKKTH